MQAVLSLADIAPEVRDIAAALAGDTGSDPDRQAWDMAVSLCAGASQEMDARRFVIGDAAALVTTRYGENTLGRFATEIGMKSGTVDEYRRVASFWNFPRRRKFEDAPLKYTHYRKAMELGEGADAFLEECLANNWDAGTAEAKVNERLGKKPSARKLAAFKARIEALNPENNVLVLRLEAGANWWPLEEARAGKILLDVTLKLPKEDEVTA